MHGVKVRLYSTPQATLNRARWLKKPVGAGAYRPWLISTDSLTARLKQRYSDFQVRALTLSNASASLDEAAYLGLKKKEHAVIREVLLIGSGQSVVFAHSVLPKKSLRGEWCRLGRLGNKPLGEALFKNPKVTRMPLMYKKLMQNHALYQKAIANLDRPPQYLWARRSVFSLGCAHLMVTEVFLPSLMTC